MREEREISMIYYPMMILLVTNMCTSYEHVSLCVTSPFLMCSSIPCGIKNEEIEISWVLVNGRSHGY